MNNWDSFEAKYGAPIGKGAQCRVYREGGTVYKVLSEGHDLFSALHEGFALAAAEKLGIPVSNIHGVYTENGHIVMEMDYVAGDTLTDLIVEAARNGDIAAMDAYLDEFVALQVKFHSQPTAGLGDVRHAYALLLRQEHGVPENAREGLRRLLKELPDGDSLCHNDFHPLNVLVDDGRYVVIDWDSAMIGDPAGDVAHTYLASMMMDEPLAPVYAGYSEKYLQKYLRATGMDRARVEAWLPMHAAILYNALGSSPEKAALYAPFFAMYQTK